MTTKSAGVTIAHRRAQLHKPDSVGARGNTAQELRDVLLAGALLLGLLWILLA